MSRVYPDGVLHHYYLIISHLRLTSHPRSTYVLQDTRIESAGTKSSCVLQNICTSRMRSQSQMRYDKIIMMTIEMAPY